MEVLIIKEKGINQASNKLSKSCRENPVSGDDHQPTGLSIFFYQTNKEEKVHCHKNIKHINTINRALLIVDIQFLIIIELILHIDDK